MTTRRPRAVLGLLFFPRGGSAHVTRALARELPAHGWDVTVVSGSVRTAESHADAAAFFTGLDVRPVDMSAALTAAEPLLADPPLHPSFEDRPGSPDRVFAAVDDRTYEHQVAAWSRELAAADAGSADVLHLNHLTPLNEAARRVAPDVPVIGHIHGTELLMLEAIASGPPPGWTHAAAWAERLRGWAAGCARLLLLSGSQAARVADLLGVPAGRCVQVPNGFDPVGFRPREIDRVAHWRRHLVDAPQGWLPGGDPGSIGYAESDLSAFSGPAPTLLYVGRYTEVKRVGLLIEAHAAARSAYGGRLPLVLLGGFPGEWEGEHPADAVARSGAEDVFIAGWHGHDLLPDFFAASDVVVLPSVREQFGQVLVEGMACGLPALAVDAFGPREIVADGSTGWLVPPDDRGALTTAILDIAADPAEVARRGALARADALAKYSWPALAGAVSRLYSAVRRQ
ncbi:MAG TPA: glycosyltransferase family 4 protein [Mycobacteriales bacterium]|nr:glycosyltransferase family 4 protein [Mycobacteriales bacterium]